MSCCTFDCFQSNDESQSNDEFKDAQEPTQTSLSEYSRTVESLSPQVQNSFASREVADSPFEISFQGNQGSIQDWKTPDETRIENRSEDEETLLPFSNQHVLLPTACEIYRLHDGGFVQLTRQYLEQQSLSKYKAITSVGKYSLAALHNDQFVPSHHRLITLQDIGSGVSKGDLFVLIDGGKGSISFEDLDMLQERIKDVFNRLPESEGLYDMIQFVFSQLSLEMVYFGLESKMEYGIIVCYNVQQEVFCMQRGSLHAYVASEWRDSMILQEMCCCDRSHQDMSCQTNGLFHEEPVSCLTVTSQDLFLLIASPSVWAKISQDEAMEIVRSHSSAQSASWELVSEARRRACLTALMTNPQSVACDDMSAVVVCFSSSSKLHSPQRTKSPFPRSASGKSWRKAVDVPSDVVSKNFENWMKTEESRMLAAAERRHMDSMSSSMEDESPSQSASFPVPGLKGAIETLKQRAPSVRRNLLGGRHSSLSETASMSSSRRGYSLEREAPLSPMSFSSQGSHADQEEAVVVTF